MMLQRLVAKLGEDAELLRAYHEQKDLMAAQILLEKKLFDSEKQDRVAMMERANVTHSLSLHSSHVVLKNYYSIFIIAITFHY